MFDPDSTDDEEEHMEYQNHRKLRVEDVINKIEIGENEETGNDDVKYLLQKYKQVFAKKRVRA